MDSKNKEILSYRNSINNHVKVLHSIKHSEEDYESRLKDINWCIDQILSIVKIDYTVSHYSTDFIKQHFGTWDTNAEFMKSCGECEDFGPNGYKSSHIEAKYGSVNTLACSDIKLKV